LSDAFHAANSIPSASQLSEASRREFQKGPEGRSVRGVAIMMLSSSLAMWASVLRKALIFSDEKRAIRGSIVANHGKGLLGFEHYDSAMIQA
jgi:hypothetical protein